METQRNHTRTTGTQDHRKSTHGDYNNAPQGFCRQLEALSGKYTLLTIKRKYKAARHLKQAYNNRLTIRARQQKAHACGLSSASKISKFCQRNGNIPIFEKLLMCVSFRDFRDSPKNNRGTFIYSQKNFFNYEV